MDADLSARCCGRAVIFAVLVAMALPVSARPPQPADPQRPSAAEHNGHEARHPRLAQQLERAPAGAATSAPWSSLSPAEREQLQPFAAQWDQLPPERQARLRRAAARWADLPPQRRAEMQERFRRWQELTPEQREQLRGRFRDFRNMPPEQQDRVRRGMKRFRDLPPGKRARLREEFERMSPPERRAFLQGAAAERRALARERWLQSLPEAEREPMRRLLDSLAPEQRRALRHLLGDTPPERQAALRKEILEMDAAARARRLSGD